MLLQPSNFIFNTKQKNSNVLNWTYTTLNYGDCGIKTLNPLSMSSSQIFRMNVLLNKAVSNPDITRSLVWFNIFPHLPLTNNGNGMRMGKGAGNLNSWHTQLSGGVFIFEFKNLSTGRAINFFNRVSVKIPTNTNFFFNNLKSINYVGQNNLNPNLSSFL